ncbi:phage virion morphogenesis protein [Leminorella grimontii]|uniref:phage virion morphogenesis protein n=1 Tax=Leminorella grimontii TaxID=82981 RepID=UPI0032203BE9
MSKITVTLDDKALRDRLTQVSGAVEKPRALMLSVAETLHAQSMKLFHDEGYPARSWQDLRPQTKKQRAAKGHWPGKILQVSGHLASSIQTDSGDNFAQLSTNLIYARIQYKGGVINRSGVVRLRTNADGTLKRQENHKNLARFAKRSHKRAVARAVNYQITIPSRRFYPLTADDKLITPAYDALMTTLQDALLKS